MLKRIPKQFVMRVPTSEIFCQHLAERYKDGRQTSFNHKRVYVRDWALSPDKKSVAFTIEVAPEF